MIQVIIVDDEPLARSIILEYLEGYAELQVVGECGNGREAVAKINEARPDLVFLDIQMPGLSGFDVIEQLTHIPQIIFSTANDALAIAAFETGAVDYLLKPYNKERFDKAVQRVLEDRHLRMERETLQQLFKTIHQPAAFPDHLFVRIADNIIPVSTEHIIWIEAAGDYSTIHTVEREYLSSQGIGALEKRLDPALFMRVHRSSIIALNAITQIKSDGEGGYKVTMAGKANVRVSRSYASKVRDLIV